MCLVLFSLVAAAFLANKDVYIKRTKYKPRSKISPVRSHEIRVMVSFDSVRNIGALRRQTFAIQPIQRCLLGWSALAGNIYINSSVIFVWSAASEDSHRTRRVVAGRRLVPGWSQGWHSVEGRMLHVRVSSLARQERRWWTDWDRDWTQFRRERSRPWVIELLRWHLCLSCSVKYTRSDCS